NRRLPGNWEALSEPEWMSVATFYEGKAKGETDEKYRVRGLAQLADFHAASSVPCAGAPKRRRNDETGRFPRVSYAACQSRLVGALVFKTSGRLEESRQWVRFPYTPAYLRKIRNAIPNPTSHG